MGLIRLEIELGAKRIAIGRNARSPVIGTKPYAIVCHSRVGVNVSWPEKAGHGGFAGGAFARTRTSCGGKFPTCRMLRRQVGNLPPRSQWELIVVIRRLKNGKLYTRSEPSNSMRSREHAKTRRCFLCHAPPGRDGAGGGRGRADQAAQG